MLVYSCYACLLTWCLCTNSMLVYSSGACLLCLRSPTNLMFVYPLGIHWVLLQHERKYNLNAIIPIPRRFIIWGRWRLVPLLGEWPASSEIGGRTLSNPTLCAQICSAGTFGHGASESSIFAAVLSKLSSNTLVREVWGCSVDKSLTPFSCLGVEYMSQLC